MHTYACTYTRMHIHTHTHTHTHTQCSPRTAKVALQLVRRRKEKRGTNWRVIMAMILSQHRLTTFLLLRRRRERVSMR